MTEVLRDLAGLRATLRGWKAAGALVGLVPTMGALHEGHLSLVRAAKAECARVVVTIFVNPKQFNRPEDLQKYPRTELADLALLRGVGADLVFVPPPEAVYPPGFATNIVLGGVAVPLEGALRPGHFDAVATVVAKLFGMTMADRAYFGEKDWQQLQVVKRLVRDLNMPVWIVGCETLRAADGLAMSSRNARLDVLAREKAPALFAAMGRAARTIRGGAAAEAALADCVVEVLAAGFDRVEYIELRDASTLDPAKGLDRPLRLLAAAWLGGVRLIDNIGV